MPHELTIDRVIYGDGGVNVTQRETTPSDNKAVPYPTVAAAKPGNLTTRTNDTDGELTMDAGHGLATGDVFDLYWNVGGVEGSRAGVVAGTVAGDVVPISGGSGDNLPADESEIMAMERHIEDVVITGNNVQAITITSPVQATVTFLQSDGTTVIGTPIRLQGDSQTTPVYAYIYQTGIGLTNPLAGGALGKVGFTHGSASAQAIKCDIRYN